MTAREAINLHYKYLRKDLKGTEEYTNDFYRRSNKKGNKLFTFFVNVETQNTFYYWTDLND
jgi:hypothetical protein